MGWGKEPLKFMSTWLGTPSLVLEANNDYF